MRMLNRNTKRLSAEVFSSAQKQPKQNASSQNREEKHNAEKHKGKASASRVDFLKISVVNTECIFVHTVCKSHTGIEL